VSLSPPIGLARVEVEMARKAPLPRHVRNQASDLLFEVKGAKPHRPVSLDCWTEDVSEAMGTIIMAKVW